MSEPKWMSPRGDRLLLHISKRKETASGIVITDTAAGYDDLRIVRRGPDAPPDCEPGRYVILAPGTYMVQLTEAPDYAVVRAEEVMGFDERTPEERMRTDSRLLIAGGLNS